MFWEKYYSESGKVHKAPLLPANIIQSILTRYLEDENQVISVWAFFEVEATVKLIAKYWYPIMLDELRNTNPKAFKNPSILLHDPIKNKNVNFLVHSIQEDAIETYRPKYESYERHTASKYWLCTVREALLKSIVVLMVFSVDKYDLEINTILNVITILEAASETKVCGQHAQNFIASVINLNYGKPQNITDILEILRGWAMEGSNLFKPGCYRSLYDDGSTPESKTDLAKFTGELCEKYIRQRFPENTNALLAKYKAISDACSPIIAPIVVDATIDNAALAVPPPSSAEVRPMLPPVARSISLFGATTTRVTIERQSPEQATAPNCVLM